MTREQKLGAYALSASVFLQFSNTALSQAIYVDLDPDVVLDKNDYLHLDIEITNDPIDFVFSNRSGTPLYTDSEHFSVLNLRPSGNAVFASGHYLYPGYRYSVFAISAGQLINDSLVFYEFWNQYMAYRTIDGPPGISFTAEGGFWYPEKLDHYVGIKFTDSLMCNHYGWIRCDVTDSGTVLTIKDYAFEMKCDVGIIAGDTIGDTTHVNIEDNFSGNLDATIYTFNNELFIIINSFANNYTVHISNLAGVVLMSNNFTSQKTNINLESFSSGVYFVEVANGNINAVRKIIITK